MKLAIVVKILIYAIALNLNANAFGNSNQVIWQQLTKSEQQYLQNLSILTVNGQPDYAPISFQHKNQQTGLGIDYLTLLSKELNILLNYKEVSNQQIAEQFNQGFIDIVINASPMDKRFKNANFSEPYLKLELAILVDKNNFQQIDSKNVLAQNVLVTIKDDPVTTLLAQKLPNIKSMTVNNINQAFKLIHQSQADIFIYPRAVLNYYINKQFESQFKLLNLPPPLEHTTVDLVLVTDQQNVQLNSLLDLAISTLFSTPPHPQIHTINKTWQLNDHNSSHNNIQLSVDEHLILKSQNQLIVGMLQNSPPFFI